MKHHLFPAHTLLFSLFLALTLGLFAACSEEGPDDALTAPMLTAADATDATRTSVTVSGQYRGHLTQIKEYGVQYSTSNNFPSDATATVRFSGVPKSSVSTLLSGLNPKTHYYYRWYASTGASTVQSETAEFTTAATSKPQLSAVTCDSIGEHTLVLRCRITDAGDDYILEQGISYREKSKSMNFTPIATDVLDPKTNEFVVVLSNLTTTTTYEVRPYAKNCADPEGNSGLREGYGETQEFTTSDQLTPEVEIYAPSQIGATSAHLSGRIKSANSSTGAVDEFGLCYSTTHQEPTREADNVILFSGKNINVIYSYDLEGLAEQTTYYVRFFAKSTVGQRAYYGYSDVAQFTTDTRKVASLAQPTVSDIAYTSAMLASGITSEGNGTITQRGFYVSSKTQTPTQTDHEFDLTADDNFHAALTQLTEGKTYYVRAYAVCSWTNGHEETVFSTAINFKTVARSLASLAQPTASDITFTSALLTSGITSEGDYPITQRGFYVSSKTQTPTKDNHEFDLTADDNFQASLTQLTEGKTYYVRAYAVCSGTDGQALTVLSGATGLTTYQSPLFTQHLYALSHNFIGIELRLSNRGSGTITEQGLLCRAYTGTGALTLENCTYRVATESYTTSQSRGLISGLTPDSRYEICFYAISTVDGRQLITYGDIYSWLTGHYNVGYVRFALSNDRTEIAYTLYYDYGNYYPYEEVSEVGVWWSETQPTSTADIKHQQVATFIQDSGNDQVYKTTITGLSSDKNYYVGYYYVFSDGVLWYNLKDAKYTGDY